jgi:hypothetical protein
MFGKEKSADPEIAGLEELIQLLNEKIRGGLKSRKEKPALESLSLEVEPEKEETAPEAPAEESDELSAEDLAAALGEDDEDELA